MPLYRDSAGSNPNVFAGVLSALQEQYGKQVGAEDLAAYIYGLLAHPGYTSRFSKQLTSRAVRVPVTKDGALFQKVTHLGKNLRLIA